eukprot:CAMPEP_0178741042 /NCGR_PEP_ID=MMETSP0744-20121128/4914_1 /TAXON_ID=913974 /ORGANISM="Nitzschia punctata, Strain CCMP561" /LENGTH=252 /DNA_ID=CAMNT_0020393859 /DNA_START=42 /DNA_END=800 /DNA_ORIENTATION=+
MDEDDDNNMSQIHRGNRKYRRSEENWLRKIPISHEVRVCLLGLLTFKLLGGRFWAVSPSSYTHMGSFARWSIPCTEKYATANQRAMIEQMGRKWGCHTCGSRMLNAPADKSFRFVGDHMPPKSVAEQMNASWLRRLGILPKVQFRFYPQCTSCSSTQGSILSKATKKLNIKTATVNGGRRLSRGAKAIALKDAGGGSTAYFHGSRFRVNHLTGGMLAAGTTVGASDKDIATGKRLERWQCSIEKAMKRQFRK